MFLTLGGNIAYAAMPSLNFTVNMSEIVNVDTTGGLPTIALTVDDKPRTATYVTGTGTNALTFTYAPTIGDLDLDGIAFASSSITIPIGSSIKDTAGNDASLTFTAPTTTGVKVNYPSLSMDFVYDADGRYTLNGDPHDTLSAFLTDASGSFTRASVGTYFDSSGVLQTASANTPRFDYDPTTHAARGILIEEQRTNSIKNSTMQNAVAGTPGTLPTNWGWTGSNGLSVSILGTGTEDGMSYIDIRFFGTTATAGPRGVGFTTGSITNTCPVTPNVPTSFSAYTRRVGGSSTNINHTSLIAGGLTSAGAATGEYKGITITPSSGPVTLNTQRKIANFTFTNASAAFYFPYIEMYPNGAGQAIDITLRISAPQCETGSFPTSFIPTTTAAVTRAADNLIIPTGTWYGAASGTLMSQSILPYVGGALFPGTMAIDDGTASNSIHLFISDAATDGKSSEIFNGGAAQFSSYGAVYTTGSSLKQAVYYNTNFARSSMDGVLGTLDTSVTVPTVTTLRIGHRRGGPDPLNGWIQKAKYYPIQVTDTQLQLLTQ